ncbi:hypothetical protein HBI07_000530 [Parastagonospora nodorum]|nr:hypothetical protein HBI07_000530 [Parastagonospora nodorum]
MPNLLSCSDELLVMIARELRFPNDIDRIQAQHDAVGLAQTCSRLKGVVDEVLYHTAIVSARKRGDSVFGGSFLLGTLVRQPQLAPRVRILDISIIGLSNRVGHNESCPFTTGERLENCLCGWLSTAGRVEEILTENDLFAGLDTLKQKWLRGIRFGKEPAILGALLACLPNLRSLTIHKRGVSTVKEFSDIEEGYTQTIVSHGQLDPWRMFGLFTMEHQDIINRIPGFAKLEHLSADCLPPMCMAKLPKLKTLQLHAFHGDEIKAWDPFRLCYWDRPTARAYFANNLHKLTILTDNNLLFNDTNIHLDRVHFIPTCVVRGAPQLTDLVLKLMPNGRDEDLYDRGGYQTLIHRVRPLQVQTLVIDSSAVERTGTGLDDYKLDEANDCFRSILPCSDISALQRLRKLVVHQEVLFNANEPFAACVLPTGIKEIGVVGTTRAINRWARHIRDSLQTYTELEVIKLWVADEGESHFAEDFRLQFSQFDSDDEDEDNEDYEDYYDVAEPKEPKMNIESHDEQEATDNDGDEMERKERGAGGEDEETGGDEDDGKEAEFIPRFTGGRSVWAELEKTGLKIVLAYHRGRPWDKL